MRPRTRHPPWSMGCSRSTSRRSVRSDRWRGRPGTDHSCRLSSVTETADVIVVGAGVQGASLAFHLARRGARVVVLERDVGGRRCDRPFVGVRADALRPRDRGASRVGVVPVLPGLGRTGWQGDCALRADRVPPDRAARPGRQRPGERRDPPGDRRPTRGSMRPRGPELVPAVVTDDFDVAAYEPRSGYADPSGHRGRIHRRGRRARCAPGPGLPGRRRRGRWRSRHRRRDRPGPFAAPVVVNVAGAWAAPLARTVGVDIPVEPWRHDTAYLRLAARPPDRLPDRHRRHRRGLLPAGGSRADAGRASRPATTSAARPTGR